MADFKSGLLPVSGNNPAILILGSFPGVISIEKNEYYGNSKNHFWKIMEKIAGIDEKMPYEKKIFCLKKKGIALWDVALECKREGSSDSTITDIIPNNIALFVRENRTIKVVALNGKTAAGKYFKRFNKDFSILFPDIDVIVLPSSSSANAVYSPEEKIDKWNILGQYL